MLGSKKLGMNEFRTILNQFEFNKEYSDSECSLPKTKTKIMMMKDIDPEETEKE